MRSTLPRLSLLISLLILTACTPAAPAPEEPLPGSGSLAWWNERVWYEVFVRSYYDSDGDGIGDLQGLTAKLDYLNDGDPATTQDLGIGGIWLMPVMQSPSYHGYDATDYYTVEADYGSNEDFKALIEAAHARGIAVIIDLVLNHSSREHPWFIASAAGEPAYADWYTWRDDDPGNAGPLGDAWHELNGRWYYGVFWEGMPDLNYETPAVTAEMQRVARFWLEEMGVDGFRLDAVIYLREDGERAVNIQQTRDWLVDFDAAISEVNPDAFTVAEAWMDTYSVAEYTGRGVDLAFEFELAGALMDSAVGRRNQPVLGTLQKVLDSYPAGQFAPFLTNHDQNRAMNSLGDVETAKLAASMLLTLPGAPFIYYGEEIGMTGAKPDELIRTPMQWSREPGGGFTEGVSWEPFAEGWEDATVDRQIEDPGSLLSHYRALIALRNAHPALSTGETLIVPASDQKVYALLRFTPDETLLVLINLGRDPLTGYSLSLEEGPLSGIKGAEMLFGRGDVALPQVNDFGGFEGWQPLPALEPQGSYIIALR